LQSKDINKVELRGACEGMCWITAKLGAQMVWVEGDSLNIVMALKELNCFGGSCLMLDYKNLLWKGNDARISHVFREANGGAAGLAC